CRRLIRDGLILCNHCGYKLIDSPSGATLPVTPLREVTEVVELPPLQCDNTINLFVRVDSGLHPLKLPAKRRLILGRCDMNVTPDVDLTAFQARELGVSRFHAAIDFTGFTFTLTDLNSQNGTDLNGLRLKLSEVHLLRHNDVICLGKPVLYVRL